MNADQQTIERERFIIVLPVFVLGKTWYDSTMIVIEAKLKGTQAQYSKLDEAIRTGQFIRNTCLRHWEENVGVTRNDLQKLCSVLAKNKETPWTKKFNSQARQTHADRA